MNPYLILGLGIIALLVATFFITFFLNKKTPILKECVNLRIGEEGCSGCKNYSCSMKDKFNLKKIEEDIEKDLKEEN